MPDMPDDDTIIRVSGSSNANSVASVVARSVVAGHSPKMRAIGAPAVNQATKAACIASGFVGPRGIQLSWVIGFDDIQGDSGDTISSVTWRPVQR